MIQEGTVLKVLDNSGEKEAYCIRVLGGKKFASIGDEIVVVTRKKRQVQRAIILQTKKAYRRNDGSRVQFNQNALILKDRKGLLLGSRLNGAVLAEMRHIDVRILSLATSVL